MSASEIMMVAVALALVGAWANNTHVTVKNVIEAVFAVLFIAFLDQGSLEPVARGFAWLFLAAVLLSKHSPINALTKAESTPAKKA